MAMTHFRSGSLKSMSSTRTKHDGHVDGNLNFIALRHGWSRSFTVAPEEIQTLDYAALEDVLELNTLKLRPVGLRVFIEHPPDSNQWAKIRPWKQDTSLASLLLNDFFERRRRDGIVLRIDVRDGHERPATDTGAVNGFASAVGSFIAGSMRSEREREQVDKAWWRLGSGSSRDRLLSASTSTNTTRRRGATEDETEDERGPPPRPKKPSFFSFLAPSPRLPPQTLQEPERRRSIFDWFRRQSSIPKFPNPVSHHVREGELEQLRKAGWKPPSGGGGASSSHTSSSDAGARTRSKNSLNDHLQSYERGEGFARRPNPFFSGGRATLNRETTVSSPPGTISASTSRGVNIFARMDSIRRGSGSSAPKSGLSRAERKKDKGKHGKGIVDVGSGEEDASEFIGYDPFGESPFGDDAAIAELFLRHTAASSISGAPSVGMSKVQPLKTVEEFKATTSPPLPPSTTSVGGGGGVGNQPPSAFRTGAGSNGGTRSRTVSFDNGGNVDNVRARAASRERATEMVDAKEMDHDHEYVSDYFEIERESSVLETNSRPSKPWQRFQTFNKTPKEKPDKGEGKRRRSGSPPRLGSGAQIVSRPMDAFPHSPHHRMMEAEAEGAIG